MKTKTASIHTGAGKYRDENQSKDFVCLGGLLQEESIASKSRKPSICQKESG